MSDESLGTRILKALSRNWPRIKKTAYIAITVFALAAAAFGYYIYRDAKALEVRLAKAKIPRTWVGGKVPSRGLDIRWDLVTRFVGGNEWSSALDYKLKITGNPDQLTKFRSGISQFLESYQKDHMISFRDSPEASPIVLRFVDSAEFKTVEVGISSFTGIVDTNGVTVELLAEGRTDRFWLHQYEEATSCTLATRF